MVLSGDSPSGAPCVGTRPPVRNRHAPWRRPARNEGCLPAATATALSAAIEAASRSTARNRGLRRSRRDRLLASVITTRVYTSSVDTYGLLYGNRIARISRPEIERNKLSDGFEQWPGRPSTANVTQYATLGPSFPSGESPVRWTSRAVSLSQLALWARGAEHADSFQTNGET